MATDQPVSTSAIQSQGRSYLFYSKPNGNLVYLKSQTEEEASANETDVPLYKRVNVMVNEETVSANPQSPQIAAISYTLNGRDEIRVYYISEEGRLQELCRSDGGLWKRGSLDNSGFQASPKSQLTASVDYTKKGQLKLYYNRENDSRMYCTWVSLGQQAWASRAITQKS